MCQKRKSSRTCMVVLLGTWRRCAGDADMPAQCLGFLAGPQGPGPATVRCLRQEKGRSRKETVMETEMRTGLAGVKFHPASLLHALTAPKQKLRGNYRPNSASTEGLGSTTLETVYATRNELAKCYFKYSSISFPVPGVVFFASLLSLPPQHTLLPMKALLFPRLLMAPNRDRK